MYLQAMTHLQKCRIIYVARVANATGLRALGGSPITVKIYWVRSHGAMEPGALHLLFCRLRPPFTYCAERAATVDQDLLVTKKVIIFRYQMQPQRKILATPYRP